jgi:hypothetical protein
VANLLTTNCQQLQSRSATFCFLVLEFICLLGAGIYLPPWYWNLSASLVLEFICWNLCASLVLEFIASLVLEFICLLGAGIYLPPSPRFASRRPSQTTLVIGTL